MRHYIIDGNNLMGKIKSLKQLMRKDGQTSREKMAFMLDNYFHNKRAAVTLCFDGYAQLAIRSSKLNIKYSDKKTADDIIKRLIEHADNPRLIILVSSDSNLTEFARVCQCSVISSEEFALAMKPGKNADPGDEKRKTISDDEIKKLFGI